MMRVPLNHCFAAVSNPRLDGVHWHFGFHQHRHPSMPKTVHTPFFDSEFFQDWVEVVFQHIAIQQRSPRITRENVAEFTVSYPIPQKLDEAVINPDCAGSAANGEVTFSVSEDSAPAGRGFSRHESLSSDACLCLWMPGARASAPAPFGIGSMSSTRLSLSMVASLQSPLLFHLAK